MFITGNGTQDIFYNNEKVLYISTHQYPYYPGSGSEKEKVSLIIFLIFLLKQELQPRNT